MPATESTWRNQNTLHRMFAVVSVVLTLATLLMFYQDWNRSWKNYQVTTLAVEQKMNQWRQEQFKTSEALEEHAALQEKLLVAKASVVPADVLTAFCEEVASGEASRGQAFNTTSLTVENEQLAKLVVAAEELATDADAAAKAAEAAPADVELAKKSADLAKKLQSARDAAAAKRQEIVGAMRGIAEATKTLEDKILGKRKFQNAEVDKAKADRDIAVRDNLDLAAPEAKIAVEFDKYEKLNLQYQTIAAHRKALDKYVRDVSADEDSAKKAVEDAAASLERLTKSFVEKRETFFVSGGLGKKFLTLPILDAFGGPRKIDNLWADGLEMDNNFRKIRRFDRCTTCHQSMDKSLPGMATTAAYVKKEALTFVLTPPTAEEMPAVEKLEDGSTKPLDLEKVFGIRLAEGGLVKADEVAVRFVVPKSVAAKARLINQKENTDVNGLELRKQIAQAISLSGEGVDSFPKLPGLMVGDVITHINGKAQFGVTNTVAAATEQLISLVKEGKPIEVTVDRGLDLPYASHPRLDLFISDSSPHKMQKFACTICHDGQGSATDFKWASHTPNSTVDAEEWRKEHGWFDNPHWIYPMQAKRFMESTCLKCHHDVASLEPSEKFPEPPAPKVVHGYHVIEKYGCYGCHEVKGFDGPTKRIGPDMRLEPMFYAVAQGILPDVEKVEKDVAAARAGAADDQAAALDQKLLAIRKIRTLTSRLIDHPDEDSTRRLLKELLESDASKATGAEPSALLSKSSHAAANLLKDIEAPGTFRKPGPSLRYVGTKLDNAFLYDWLKDPTAFRPSTRMPKFFGLWDHLASEKSQKTAHDLEPIEIRGIMEYLYSNDQAFEPLKRPEGISEWTDEEKAARGKVQFETRGCLACHTHEEFPDTAKFRRPEDIVQGPDLSGIGAKFDPARNKQGKSWLYSWIKEPTKYHARTVMPNLYLDPIKDAEGKVSDPADDIATYLMSFKASNNWAPAPEASTPLDDAMRSALKDLSLEHMYGAFYKDVAAKYYETGIPAELRKELKGAEMELVVEKGQTLDDAQRLRYIGNKTISKYGCFGCHDIPGFEDAKPIGTGLADWGRKDPSKLAFEHISHYLQGHGHGGGHSAGHGADGSHGEEHKPTVSAEERAALSGMASKAMSKDAETAEDEEYFHHQIESGNRIGFIYQKLKEPRSYDYMKTETKGYNERLRMPKFPFTEQEREAVMTFVLGLVAEPPRESYVYKPDARTEAILAGKKVIEKFNCGGCHILEGEKWKVAFESGSFNKQDLSTLYPFLLEHANEKTLKTSATPDSRNRLTATLEGLPAIDGSDALPAVRDEEGLPVDADSDVKPAAVKVAFDLWKSTPIEGSLYVPGQSALQLNLRDLEKRQFGEGGLLTRYLLPRVIQMEKAVNTQAKGDEAYAWLPPPLMGEGEKVQSQWLHDFLLEPYPIRPATYLRMPRFNMSSHEAWVLANYFAAVDNPNYPADFKENQEDSRLRTEFAEALRDKAAGSQGAEVANKRLNSAMQIVVNKNYCVACHRVGDFAPTGSIRAQAPNLADVQKRLRPDYVRRWIANPKQILPYTAMPINIKYDPAAPHLGGISQELFPGTSIEQVDGLVDLLMNFDQYAKGKTSISSLVPAGGPADAAPAAGGDAPPAAADGT